LAKRFLTDHNLAVVEALTEFAESCGHTILDLAFSWLASRPVVASVIAGATSSKQVWTNVNAARWRLGPDDFAEVDRILEGVPVGS
jgi:aryl-alcohol dehydrogenase-like predicted oxidoreductase